MRVRRPVYSGPLSADAVSGHAGECSGKVQRVLALVTLTDRYCSRPAKLSSAIFESGAFCAIQTPLFEKADR